MAKSEQIFARVEPEVKAQSEEILDQLGLSMSNAIGLFLNQLVLRRGLPFDVVLPSSGTVDMSQLTKAEFDAIIRKGMDDVAAGRTKPLDAVKADMRRDYGV